MYGNILQGSYIYGDKLLGVYVTEVTSNISESTSGIRFRGHGTFTSYPSRDRVPDLDIVIDISGYSARSEQAERFVPKIGFKAYGGFDEFGTTAYVGFGFNSYCNFIIPEIVASGPSRFGFKVSFDFILEHPNENSIAWSNIGELDFTVGQDNVAGNMPIDSKGYVLAIEQLATSNLIYVYSENGIAQISPKGVYYSRKEISNLGVKSKHSVVNTGDTQYFISTNNNLYRINSDSSVTLLGYSEFLISLIDPVMSYDNFNKYIYICDGTNGFIYSVDSDCLTVGPPNVTSIHYRDDEFIVGAPADIVIPDFILVTDVYDMGTKKEKTIFEFIVNSSDPTGLELSIDYKILMDEEFVTLPYVDVGPFGVVKRPCFGREFRFRVKGTGVAETFKIESITVNGVIHGFSFLDTITIK